MTAAHPFVSRLRPWRSSIAAVAGLAMMVAPAFAATTRTLLTVSPNSVQYGTPVTMTATVVTDATSFTSALGHIGSGGNHTCAKSAVGIVSCWGSNSDGQLGDGTTTDSLLPVNVKTSSNSLLQGVDTIAVGGRHSCAVLTTDGKVMCWGANAGGQLGDGEKTSRSKADFVKKSDGDPFPNVAAL
ncbi:MAG TPA: hypothetical protein VMP03_06785, partial [Methylomirabilota bacterium]|nr:hypothetical protein [Methylomirabilota bacterium]